MLCGKRPDFHQLTLEGRVDFPFEIEVSAEGKFFLESCLKVGVVQRLDPVDARHHVYFNG